MRPRRVRSGREEGDAAPRRHERRQRADLGRLALREVARHHRSQGASGGRLDQRDGLALELRLEERLHPSIETIPLLLETRHRLRQIPLSRREGEGEIAEEEHPLPLAPKGSPAADESHAGPPLVFLGGEDGDDPDLAAPAHVGPAAGRPIESRHLHDPHHALDGGELAEREAPHLLARDDVHHHLTVLPDHLVRALLHATQELRVRAGMDHVDRHLLLAQMEGARLRGGHLEERLGQDVLAGVLLHVIEAPGPIEDALNPVPRSESPLGPMPDASVLLARVGHPGGAEPAAIGGLSSPARIEGGLVQLCPERAVLFQGLHYRAVELADGGIFVVEKPGQERSLGTMSAGRDRRNSNAAARGAQRRSPFRGR